MYVPTEINISERDFLPLNLFPSWRGVRKFSGDSLEEILEK